MRKNRGITLIALVLTIIVLLILAGVSIAMLSGDNGLLKRAGQVFLPILLFFTYFNYLNIDYLPAVRHLLHIVERLLNRWD